MYIRISHHPILFILICLHATQRVCVCTVKSFNTSLVFQTMTAKSRPHKAKLTMHPDANKRICLVQRMVEGITCKNHGVAKWQKSPYK